MNFDITQNTINSKIIDTVSARDIWIKVESKQDFSTWIKKRVEQSGFEEHFDFVILWENSDHKIMDATGRTPQSMTASGFTQEYYISLDMAKHLGMMERNDKGKDVRQHFIDFKEQFQTPKTLEEITLQAIAGLTKKIEQQQKSLDVKDIHIRTSNEASIQFGEVDMATFVKENSVVLMGVGLINCYAWMRAKGWIYLDENKPKQFPSEKGYMTLKLSKIQPNGKYSFQVMITPSGKKYFLKKFIEDMDKYNCVNLYSKNGLIKRFLKR